MNSFNYNKSYKTKAHGTVEEELAGQERSA